MACAFSFTVNSCVLEISCAGEIEASFDLSTVTWMTPTSDTVQLKDGSGNRLTTTINNLTGYATPADFVTFVAGQRLLCIDPSGTLIGGGPYTVANDTPSDGYTTVTDTNTGETFVLKNKHSQTFLTGTWVAGAGVSTISITEATHEMGLNPFVQVFDTAGDLVGLNNVTVDGSGNIVLEVTAGLEFDGKVVIL